MIRNVRMHRERQGQAPSAERIREARSVGPVRLAARAWELAHQHGMKPLRITVRGARSKWGSCSVRGHIMLNWRLALAPQWVIDYVILHELMHLKEHNHGPKYWQLVEGAFPERRNAEAWLKREGPILLTV